MKSGNLIRTGVAVSVVLAAAAFTLYWLARNSGAEDYRRSIDKVQQIEQLAANWSIETARVRSDPMADFDSLAAFIPRMDTLKDALLATVRSIPDIPDRLANDVSAYISAIEAKEERIERFKTGYAVIRNSSRYLPLAASNIVQVPNVETQLSAEVAGLTNEINAYLNAPTDAVKGRLTVALERLADSGANLVAPLPNYIANFVAHAEVLLAQQAPTGELFDQATSNEVSDLSAQLINDFGFQLSRKQEVNSYYMNGILAAVGLLLTMWIVLAVQRARAGAPAVVEVVHGDAAAADQVRAQAGPAPARADSTSAKLLMSHRIVANLIAERLAEAAHSIAAGIDTPDGAEGDAVQAKTGGGPGKAASDQANSAETAVGIRERAAEIAQMAEHLSSFSNAGDGTGYGLINVNDCIGEVVEATRAESSASVVMDCGKVPEIFASRTEICLMLEKVLENSAQAIEDAGNEEGEISIVTTGDNDKASITIIDNGIGMTAEERERMFEPFYAGRDGRVGAGLLSTSYLVDKYNGSISVNSMPGGGTVTRIMLPGMPES